MSAAREPERGMSDEEQLRALLERLNAEEYQSKGSIDVVSALEMEITSDPDLSRYEIARRSGVGDSTLRGWTDGTASPTFKSVQKVARTLHPSSSLGDYLTWLTKGREWRLALEKKLADIELERRRAAVIQAAEAELEGRWTADAVMSYLERLDPHVRAMIARQIVSGWVQVQGSELEPEVEPDEEERKRE